MDTDPRANNLCTLRSHGSIQALEPRLLLATLPPGFFETRIAEGLETVTAMTLAPDGRIFVSEQAGKIRVIKDNQLLPEPFATLPVFNYGELGLQSVALDPNFDSNHFVYVFYTGSDRHDRVVRLTADGDSAVPGSELTILEFPETLTEFHVSGSMHFLPDGTLMVAHGDNNLFDVAQSLESLFGKILRIYPDGTIPTDNPFYDQTTGIYRSIWAMGLRNPYTFAIQPGTNRIFINDVGISTWEEINEGVAGANYGYPLTEGDFDPLLFPGFKRPIHVYKHPSFGAAITGGTFYNPVETGFPAEYVGSYFFCDYSDGTIRRLDLSGPVPTAVPFADGVWNPLYLTTAPDGSLYYLERGLGIVWQIQHTNSLIPQISNPPVNRTVSIDQPAVFEVVAAGEALVYQWQRDGVDIPGANAARYTLASPSLLDDQAVFRCVITNSYGSVTSSEATLTVLNNHLPVPVIIAPAAGVTYTGAAVISFLGGGADLEDGIITPAGFSWRVDFHHHTHTHPFIPTIDGIDGGAFVIPIDNEPDPDVWYRIYFTVRDSHGASQTTYRDVLPVLTRLTVDIDVPGFVFMLDGQLRPAPYSFDAVVGIQRGLEAPLVQMLGDQQYEFVGWSNGRPASHLFLAGFTDEIVTAIYRDATPPQVLEWSFDWNNSATPHAIRVRFSEDISSSLASGDLNVINLATSQIVSPDLIAYDPVTWTAEFRIPGLFGDGSYVARFGPSAVKDSGENEVSPSNAFGFNVLAGDANRDGRVDVKDLIVLATNFGTSAKLFSDGDFNYDGTVNATDLAILSARWGREPVLPVTGIILPALPTSPSRTPARQPTRISTAVLQSQPQSLL